MSTDHLQKKRKMLDSKTLENVATVLIQVKIPEEEEKKKQLLQDVYTILITKPIRQLEHILKIVEKKGRDFNEESQISR